MLQKYTAWLFALPLLAVYAAGQGLDTNATKDNWEEINFEYNSSVLVDGFPSLLRLSELLKNNPGYRVKVEGHTDIVGGRGAKNDALGMARGNTVRDFLVKYGAAAGQIQVTTVGANVPKAPGERSVYSKTDEARWMNRRVELTVTDDQGRVVSAAGVGDAIRAIQQPVVAANPDCCNEVLRKLDKLDTLEQMLKDLGDQNRALRDQLAGLTQSQDALRRDEQALKAQVDALAGAPKPPTTAEVATAVTAEIEKKKDPRFELLGMNVGANQDGHISFTGKGRYFAPFGDKFAFQSEGEYFYNKGQREGQFDFGLVNRIGRFQAGLFSSFKHVNLTGDQTGGTLGQGAVTLDYLFGWGKIGAYGTKAFLDDALLNRSPVTTATGAGLNNLVTERYLRVVDQAGINATLGLIGNTYMEGNVGYLRSTTAGDRLGGTLRFIFPVSSKVAFTVEGGVNETLLGRENNGRAVAGVQFGNFMRPKEYLAAAHAVPVQIPRLRYEALTRTVRTGNAAPVADAGPNQTLASAATVTLNGSGSYDPDGDPITYQWVQESGPAVALASATSAITTFAAASGQTYGFQLTVKDPGGLKSTARVTITVGTPVVPPTAPTIASFTANPTSIVSGNSSTLSWQVTNADNVSITTLGFVGLTGSSPVSPTATTTYILTAVKGALTVTASATVIVTTPPPAPLVTKIVAFTADPLISLSGRMVNLDCEAQNATSISVAGRLFQGNSAILSVKIIDTTTYTCVAIGPTNSDSKDVTVTVTGPIDP